MRLWKQHDITVFAADQVEGRYVPWQMTVPGRGTGAKPASNAGKLLRKPKTPKNVKDAAASDLAQAPRHPKKTTNKGK